jgi:hypothetical protein
MGRKKLYIVKNCIVCLKEFEPRQPNGSSNPKIKVCSISCRGVLGGRAGIGRPTPQIVKDKIRKAQTGKKGNNWKGGIWNSQPQSERKTSKYKNLRKKIFERDYYKCVLCDKMGDLNMDHIKPYSKYPELRYDESNLRTLCMQCHKKTPTYARNNQYQE